MNKTPAHLLTGEAGENHVATSLAAFGWKILARNWRPEGRARGLELDVVARDKETLVFVEVKTRKRIPGKDIIPAMAAFNQQKQKRLVQAAQHYLAQHNLWHTPCRFDLCCLDEQASGQYLLEHFKNVIELGNIVDSKHTSWQPW